MRNRFHATRRIGLVIFLIASHGSARLLAQTNSEATNAPLKLLPPYDELAPSYWEQHGAMTVFAGLGFVLLVTAVLRVLLRSRPEPATPPGIEARNALEKLGQMPEDGAVLSQVSQVVRNYFRAAFQLPPGELTTTEYCREISGQSKVGAELADAVAKFLRDCDDHKFPAAAVTGKIDAAKRALQLVGQAEQRRARYREFQDSPSPETGP